MSTVRHEDANGRHFHDAMEWMNISKSQIANRRAVR